MTGLLRGAKRFLERQRPDTLEIAFKIEERCVSVRQIESDRFGLARTGGEINAIISDDCRYSFEFHEKVPSEAAPTMRWAGPDALQLGGNLVKAP